MHSVILSRLQSLYPSVRCQLSFSTPFELAVAVILSAQCTDVRVNAVTPMLFSRCKEIRDYISLPRTSLESIIFSCGYYRSKARYIQELAAIVLDRYKGELPRSVTELALLPGIGRKTANVITQEAFGVVEGVVVDTHVLRNSYRLGFGLQTKNAEIQEKVLMKTIPQEYWYRFSHYMILLGRSYCTARSPRCAECPLRDVCPQKLS